MNGLILVLIVWVDEVDFKLVEVVSLKQSFIDIVEGPLTYEQFLSGAHSWTYKRRG